MPATGFLVVRISAACMALACRHRRRASRSRPGSMCFRGFSVHQDVLGHRVEHVCALRLAMLSSRVQTCQLWVRQHPTNKSTHVLLETREEPHLLTDCTRRRLHRRIVDEPMSSQSSLTPTATRQPNPGKDGAFRFEHACWSRAHPLDRAGELRSMHVPAARQHRAQSARPDRGQHCSQALERHEVSPLDSPDRRFLNRGPRQRE